MRFPPEFIERLRHHAPLSSIIGKRLSLRRHGRESMGLCPFHAEKTPSFTVNDEKGFFHCFGCGAHGDVIGFIKDHERLTYPEAVQRLAAEVGVAIPTMNAAEVVAERKRQSLEDVMQWAARWFRAQLQQSGAQAARQYVKERGLTAEIEDRFMLGYAPAERDALKKAFLKEGGDAALLQDAGLVIHPDEGASYDRFRARLMFPICNSRGQVIAFGGRILPELSKTASGTVVAKYLNSPETPLFKKGENLFAYHLAKETARQRARFIVAEGYMDVIALHQAGFTEAVAPLGTAVTPAQLQLLWRMVSRPVFCLDGDEAGQRAMMKVVTMALPLLTAEAGLAFVTLPSGEDPDSVLRHRGKAVLQQLLKSPRLLSEWLWEEAYRRFPTEAPEGRAALGEYLSQMTGSLRHAGLKKQMENYFRSRLYEISSFKKRSQAHPLKRPGVEATPLPATTEESLFIKIIQEQILALIIVYPNLLQHAEVEERLAHMEFTNATLDKLCGIILEMSADLLAQDSTALREKLESRGFGEKVNTLLQKNHTMAFLSSVAKEAAHGASVFRNFNTLCHNHTAHVLTRELREAEKRFEQEQSDANFDRLRHLQQQVNEMQKSAYALVHNEQYI